MINRINNCFKLLVYFPRNNKLWSKEEAFVDKNFLLFLCMKLHQEYAHHV